MISHMEMYLGIDLLSLLYPDNVSAFTIFFIYSNSIMLKTQMMGMQLLIFAGEIARKT